jgi:hypothetical protein
MATSTGRLQHLSNRLKQQKENLRSNHICLTVFIGWFHKEMA